MIAFGVFISVAKLRENLHVSAGRAPLVVNVSGGQWWWEIDTYEIAMGQEVESCVKTEDVTHGMGTARRSAYADRIEIALSRGAKSKR